MVMIRLFLICLLLTSCIPREKEILVCPPQTIHVQPDINVYLKAELGECIAYVGMMQQEINRLNAKCPEL